MTFLDGVGQDRSRGLIVSHIAPDFRLERNPKDPVAGSGREAVYISKKLDEVDLESLVVYR